MQTVQKLTLTTLAGAFLLASCASDRPIKRGEAGAAVGAVTGAILGHQIDDDSGRFIGAALGAITGAAVGSYMDKQQQALEDELKAERDSDAIQVARVADDTLRLDLSSEVSFAVNSALISGEFYKSLNKVAGVLTDYPETAVHIIGHTDSSGPASYNQKLSVDRAKSVSTYLASQGVIRERIKTVGRGESAPVADNNTEQGRSENRRVEIFLKTIVEGKEQQAFDSIG